MFGFIDFEKEVEKNATDSLKKAVKERTVLEN